MISKVIVGLHCERWHVQTPGLAQRELQVNNYMTPKVFVVYIGNAHQWALVGLFLPYRHPMGNNDTPVDEKLPVN